jgi:hypothetical protein
LQLGGEFQKWGKVKTVTSPQVIMFRWGYYGSAAKSAYWQLSDKPFTSDKEPALIKKGLITQIPQHGKVGIFNINFLDYIPKTPPATSKNYYVRVVPLDVNSNYIESPSLPVTITYTRPGTVTEFTHPSMYDPRLKRSQPVYKVRIHAIRTANDNGSQAATITPDQVKTYVDQANLVWWQSGIEFLFDPKTDFEQINLTNLNRLYPGALAEYENNKHDPNWEYKAADNSLYSNMINYLVQKYQGKVLVIFMYGSKFVWDKNNNIWKVGPITGGVSCTKCLYIRLPKDMGGKNSLAHELGHYFHVSHPFGQSVATVAEASQKLKDAVEKGSVPANDALSIFDGDRGTVTDTPADVRSGIFVSVYGDNAECGPHSSIQIPVVFSNGARVNYTLKPDRLNIMSYFKGCHNLGTHHLSPQQIKRARSAIENGNRKHLIQ